MIGKIVGIILLLGIAFGGFYVYLNLKTPAKVVPQTLQPLDTKFVDFDNARVLSRGSFTEIDAYHKGSGEAVIYEVGTKSVLRFENFSVAVGPDLFVYLSKNTTIKKARDLGEFVSLGKLKAQQGEQVYTLPDNYTDYRSVVIWCRAFGVPFSSADLQ